MGGGNVHRVSPYSSALYKNLLLNGIPSNLSPQQECFVPIMGVFRLHKGVRSKTGLSLFFVLKISLWVG